MQEGEDSLAHLRLLADTAFMLPASRAAEAEELLARVTERLSADSRFAARMLVSQTWVNLAMLRSARGDLDGAFAALAAAVPAAEELRAELWRVRSAFEAEVTEPWQVTPPLVRAGGAAPGAAR